MEECLPTVRGRPDHGDVWSRPWTGTADDAEVGTGDGLRLRREIIPGDTVRVRYTISGRPGSRFVHAAHALLEVGPTARVRAPGVSTMTVLDVDDPVRPWPSGLDRLGPDDGTATCVVLPGCGDVSVADGDARLRFRWSCPADPGRCSLLFWRNLGGWPADGPYRSIGIEPMLGRTAESATGESSTGGLTETAVLGPTGVLRWALEVSAARR